MQTFSGESREEQVRRVYVSYDVEEFFVSSSKLPADITLHEVGPRDGLQNEHSIVSTEVKLRLIQSLIEAGLTYIEAGAFVSPKWVPQMADTTSVFESLSGLVNTKTTTSSAEGSFEGRRSRSNSMAPSLVLAALTPNMKGFENAVSANVSEIAVFTACSEKFCLRNINRGIQDSLEVYRNVCSSAIKKNIRVRGYVSCAWGCPYEGEIPTHRVLEIVKELLGMGCYEVALGDTIGVATPTSTHALLAAVFQPSEDIPVDRIAVHFHDTSGMALRNILVALQFGVHSLDASISGLGGCPYAGGAASGNVATEKVAHLLQSELLISCGLNESKLWDAVHLVNTEIKTSCSFAGDGDASCDE